MKKAFTLLELMIAIAVLVTLMGLVFRLNIAGADNKKRIETVMRMQKLENCMSGYYAAFGSYPPVKLHQSRNYNLAVNKHGMQSSDGKENVGIWSWSKIGEYAEKQAWRQVRAACLAQPLDCSFPYQDSMEKRVREVSDEMRARAEAGKYDDLDLGEEQIEKIIARFSYGFGDNEEGQFDKGAIDWRDIQIFQFGAMSYLFPRYLVMMKNKTVNYGEYSQWTANNPMPSNALTGRKFDGWEELRDSVYSGGDEQIDKASQDYASVANIPSQAVCARWMPNLEGICSGTPDPGTREINLYGVNVWDGKTSKLEQYNPTIKIYGPNEDGTESQYVLDSLTVRDGWGNDFYYYSPAPYQRYILWSAGDNGRTFPQWVDRSQLGNKANECIGKWIQDDIIHLSN